MSYREVRSFVESMRSLGYPRLISLENFRTPNFELVADCLHWLVQRFYPESSISVDIATEGQRVAFLQSVAQVMLTKARMKLNLRRLYAADGQAVRELLKLASLLCKATASAEAGGEDAPDAADVGAALRALDPRAAKDLASDAARAGAALADALASELAARAARAAALTGGDDASRVAAAVSEAVASVEDALSSLRSQIGDLAASEAALDAKLERRRGEVERAEKRLATLAAVRPAYMDEYEALEAQLQILFTHYLERHRNLQYLEAQLDGYHRAEAEAMEVEAKRLRKMQRRLADEEMRILRGEAAVDESRLGGSGATTSTTSNSSAAASDDEGPGDQRGSRGGRLAGSPGATGFYRPGGGGGGAAAVVGSLGGGGWGGDGDDDVSVDEDGASDAGPVSVDSGDGGGGGRGGQRGEFGFDEGSGVASEDSGF